MPPSPPSPLRHARSADESRLQRAFASPSPAPSTSTTPYYPSYTPRSRLPQGFPYASSLWVAQFGQQAQQWQASRSFLPRPSKDTGSEPRRASTSTMLSDSDAGGSGENGDVDLDLTVELPSAPASAALNKPSFTSIPISPSLTALNVHPSSPVSGRQSPSSPSERPYDQQRHRLDSSNIDTAVHHVPPLSDRIRTRCHSAHSAVSLPSDSQGWSFNVTPSLLSMNGGMPPTSERSNTPDLVNQSAGDSSGSSFGQDHRIPPAQTTSLPRMPETIRERRKKTSPTSAITHRRLSSTNSLRILPPALVKAFGSSAFPSPSRPTYRAPDSAPHTSRFPPAPSPLHMLNMSPSTTADGFQTPSTPGMAWSPRTTISQGTTVATSPIESVDHDDDAKKPNFGRIPASASFGLGITPLNEDGSHYGSSSSESRMWGWKSITSSLFAGTKTSPVKGTKEEATPPHVSEAGAFPTPQSAFQHILSGRSSCETNFQEPSLGLVHGHDEEAVEELRYTKKDDRQTHLDKSSGIPFVSVSTPEQVESEWNTARSRTSSQDESDDPCLSTSASHTSGMNVDCQWQSCCSGHTQHEDRKYRETRMVHDVEDDILTVPQDPALGCSSRFSDSSTSVINQHSRITAGTMMKRFSLVASSAAFLENQRKRKESIKAWSRRASTLFNSRATPPEEPVNVNNASTSTTPQNNYTTNEESQPDHDLSTPNLTPTISKKTTLTAPATPHDHSLSTFYIMINHCIDYLDETVPSKLCFEMGFIFGPWCWVIGGWWLRSADGELNSPSSTALPLHPSPEQEEGASQPESPSQAQAQAQRRQAPYCRKHDAYAGQIWIKRNRQAAGVSGGVIFVITVVVIVLAIK